MYFKLTNKWVEPISFVLSVAVRLTFTALSNCCLQCPTVNRKMILYGGPPSYSRLKLPDSKILEP